ncbi:MAG: hypothetical protein J0M30_14735 [Chitinophagales bacterium]|nr:hypothetical protein [Chitinophagales bacterium]
MRRFLITNNEKFTGTAEIVFGPTGTLARVDISNCNFSDVHLSGFLKALPIHLKLLEQSFSASTTVVEADFEVTFEMFWQSYGKKINRKRAEPIWDKLSKSNKVKAYFGISQYDKFLQSVNWRKKADPEKYLRDQYWENEYSG